MLFYRYTARYALRDFKSLDHFWTIKKLLYFIEEFFNLFNRSISLIGASSASPIIIP